MCYSAKAKLWDISFLPSFCRLWESTIAVTCSQSGLSQGLKGQYLSLEETTTRSGRRSSNRKHIMPQLLLYITLEAGFICCLTLTFQELGRLEFFLLYIQALHRRCVQNRLFSRLKLNVLARRCGLSFQRANFTRPLLCLLFNWCSQDKCWTNVHSYAGSVYKLWCPCVCRQDAIKRQLTNNRL